MLVISILEVSHDSRPLYIQKVDGKIFKGTSTAQNRLHQSLFSGLEPPLSGPFHFSLTIIAHISSWLPLGSHVHEGMLLLYLKSDICQPTLSAQLNSVPFLGTRERCAVSKTAFRP